MKLIRFSLCSVLCGAIAGAAQPRGSLVPPPPLPVQKPPVVTLAPPAVAGRMLALNETVSDDQARLELARTLSYLKRYDESLQEYRKVLAQRPADNAVRAEYGQVLFWSGNQAGAYAEISRVPAAELSPDAKLALADLSVGLGKFTEAAALFADRVKAAPDDLESRFKLAEVLSWLKRYDESLALYRGLIEARPDDVQLRRRYALVLVWAGQLDAAAGELRRTLPSS